MNTETPNHVNTVIIPPRGWDLVDDRIREGDWYAGVLSYWQPCGESVGHLVKDTGFRAVIRKSK